MKILFGVIVLATAYSALACGVEPQGNKTATPTADTTSLAAATTGTPPATGTPRSPSPAATPVDPVEIQIDDKIISTPVAGDEAGGWEALTLQGVTVEVPVGPRWEVSLQYDPCFGDLRRRVVVQDKATGDRIRIDMAIKTVTVALTSPPAMFAKIIGRIEASLSGVRALPTELANVPLLPTSPACDPSAAIPTLGIH